MTIEAQALADILQFDIVKAHETNADWNDRVDYEYMAFIPADMRVNNEWDLFNTKLREFQRDKMTQNQISRWAIGQVPMEPICNYFATIWNRNNKNNHPSLDYTLREVCFDELHDIYSPWYDTRKESICFDIYLDKYAWLPIPEKMMVEFTDLLGQYVDGTYPYRGDFEVSTRWNQHVKEVLDGEQ